MLEHPEWKMQQIGISNLIEERLNRLFGNGWELTQVRGSMEGSLTASLERSALNALAARGAKLGKRGGVGKFDADTESWSISSLVTTNLEEILCWIYQDEAETADETTSAVAVMASGKQFSCHFLSQKAGNTERKPAEVI